jgi:hypothetical protein
MSHEQQHTDKAGPSRRKVIISGAGLAAAGLVVGAGVPLATSQLAGGDHAEPGSPVAAPTEPVMIHLRDAASGHFDVFVGTGRLQFTDRAFAARLSDAVSNVKGE